MAAPLIEELGGPGGRVVIPELLKGFLEQVNSDGPEVVPEQIVQAEALLGFQILFAFEQEPTRFLQQRYLAAGILLWPLVPTGGASCVSDSAPQECGLT